MFNGDSAFSGVNGNSADQGASTRSGTGRPVPTWKGGVSVQAMMAGALSGGAV